MVKPNGKGSEGLTLQALEALERDLDSLVAMGLIEVVKTPDGMGYRITPEGIMEVLRGTIVRWPDEE